MGIYFIKNFSNNLHIKFDIIPKTKSKPANIISTRTITISIQMANFNRYQPMIAATIITTKRTANDRSINPRIIFLQPV